MRNLLLITILTFMIVFMGCTPEHSDEHDHSVEIEGKDMKLLTVQEVADLWEINSEVLLQKMILEFDLKESYTVNSILEDIRDEYKFSPAMMKDFAEEIKNE